MDDNNQPQSEDTPDQEELLLPQSHSKEVEFRSVEDVMESSYLTYSMSVIVARALPDVVTALNQSTDESCIQCTKKA